MSQTRVFPRVAVSGLPRPVLAAFCLAAALVAGGLVGSRLAAAPLPPDPVEQFRDVLKADTGLVDNPRGLAARRKKLTDQINALADLGDMARILLLREWRTDETEALTRAEVYKIDTNARNQLMQRFENGVKRTVARGTYAEQAAVAFLIGETATKVRSLVVANPFLLSRFAELAPELIQLSHSTNARVRGAAALALANAYGKDPKNPDRSVVLPVLERLLTDPSVQTRIDAAQALLTYMQLTADISRSSAPAPAAPGRTAPPMRVVITPQRQMLETFELGVRAATLGMVRRQPVQVRRLSTDAMRQITLTLPRMVPALRDLAGYPYPSIPIKDWSEDELRNARADRERFDKLKQDTLPLRRLLQRQAPILAQAIVDPDGAVRGQASRVVEDLGIIRDELTERDRLIPTFPTPAKEEPKKPAPAGADGPVLRHDPGRRSGPLEALPATEVVGRAAPAGPVAALGQPVKTPTPPPTLAALHATPARTAPPLPPRGGQLVSYQPPRRVDTPPAAWTATVVESLRAELKSPDIASRLAALDALEVLGNAAADAVPDLARALCDGNKFVRWGAARALSKMRPQPTIVVPPLIHLLSDQDLDVRLAAINALRLYGPEARGAVTALALRINRGDPEAREEVIRALEAIGTAAGPALPAMAWAVIKDPDPRVRRTAANTLGRFGKMSLRAIPALNTALTDPDPDVRRAASEALLKIEGK